MQLPTLPFNVLENILSRLPVKSLMRFKCVSKSINSLVNDPAFVRLHLEMTSKIRVFVTAATPQIILCEMIDNNENGAHAVTIPIEYPSLMKMIPAEDIEIIGSSNGLLCFMVAETFTADLVDFKFVLWNPMTRVFREIVKPPGPFLGIFPDTIPLYGFGYDYPSGDYKIIRAVSPCINGTNSTDLDVYSLKENVWRKKQASLPCILTAEYWRMIEPFFPGIYSRGAGVLASGALHWREKRGINAGFHESDLILSFNLAKEEFEEVVPLLEYNKEDSYPTELLVWEGKISMSLCNWKTSEIEIWVMKEYGVKDSWNKIATMPDNPGPAFEESFTDDWFAPLVSCGNDHLLVDMNGSEVLIYDQKMRTFSNVELGDNQELFLVQDFVESLVSPYVV